MKKNERKGLFNWFRRNPDQAPSLSPEKSVHTSCVVQAPSPQPDSAISKNTEHPAAEQKQTLREPSDLLDTEKTRSFFQYLKDQLGKTRRTFSENLRSLFFGAPIDSTLFSNLETQLLLADVGIQTTRKLLEQLKKYAKEHQLKTADTLYFALQNALLDIVQPLTEPLLPCIHHQQETSTEKKTFCIVVVGVNGAGKTTTIGKLALQLKQQGLRVMLAAGDTFRAGAVAQLEAWGNKYEIPVLTQPLGTDPAAAIFDALQSARAKKYDVLIADTAGRLQNKVHLMQELAKIIRVIKKIDPEAPHEVMLIIDATTGQNGLLQAKQFHYTVPISGITLTKLDGTAKGGILFSISDQLKLPIRYVGIGERVQDLSPFNPKLFIDALFNQQEAP